MLAGMYILLSVESFTEMNGKLHHINTIFQLLSNQYNGWTFFEATKIVNCSSETMVQEENGKWVSESERDRMKMIKFVMLDR